jgi:hypothetical protein
MSELEYESKVCRNMCYNVGNRAGYICSGHDSDGNAVFEPVVCYDEYDMDPRDVEYWTGVVDEYEDNRAVKDAVRRGTGRAAAARGGQRASTQASTAARILHAEPMTEVSNARLQPAEIHALPIHPRQGNREEEEFRDSPVSDQAIASEGGEDMTGSIEHAVAVAETTHRLLEDGTLIGIDLQIENVHDTSPIMGLPRSEASIKLTTHDAPGPVNEDMEGEQLSAGEEEPGQGELEGHDDTSEDGTYRERGTRSYLSVGKNQRRLLEQGEREIREEVMSESRIVFRSKCEFRLHELTAILDNVLLEYADLIDTEVEVRFGERLKTEI